MHFKQNSNTITAGILVLFFISACAINKGIKDGAHAYQLKQYSVAIDMLVDEFASEKNENKKAEIAFLIADSYQKKNDYSNAVDWFSTSLGLYDRLETLHALAFAFKKTEQYSKAANAFAMLYEESDDKEKYRRELQICKEVSSWKEEDNKFIYRINSSILNSASSDYGVSKYKDDQILFVSDRESEFNDTEYKWTGNAFSDLYVSDLNGRYVESFDAPINSDNNEGPPCFNATYDEIFFTRCVAESLRNSHCRLFYSYFINEEWTEPLPLNFFDENVNYGNPTLLLNDSILVFSANVADNHDLYYAERQEGGWSEATPMPDYLNTDGNEMFPSSDGDTLYYSSDMLIGLGGLDIFKTYIMPNGKFSQPVNMSVPLNSGYDDFSYIVTEREDSYFKGFFSSNRGASGTDDIFRYQASLNLAKKEKEEAEKNKEEEPTDLTEIYLALKVVSKETATSSKGPLGNATLEIQNGNSSSKESADDSGRYITTVNRKDVLVIKASSESYYANTITINIADEIPDEYNKSSYTINKTIELEPIVVGEEIVLENIYYDYEKWNIRADAEPSLNALADKLRDNPSIRIQLSSHTDCRGDIDYNQELSQKRAQSAVDYIIGKGISSQRIVAKGYGESNLAVTCSNCDDCSEDEHQQNRRTTFKVLE